MIIKYGQLYLVATCTLELTTQVYTIDPKNEAAIREVIRLVLSINNFTSYLPYEFTQKGMLERVGLYIFHQDFCDGENIAIGKKGLFLFYICTVFPWIKSWAFISFPVSKTQHLNEGGFYLRPGIYFQHFSFAPSIYLNLCTL